ncbi:hypothetical protein C8J57DRAFT_1053896, partial [Mycena rebaudengoi]
QEIFNALLLITPCSFLLLLMQILIFQQYGQEVNLQPLVGRTCPERFAVLSVFIFYTSRHKRDWRMQLLLFAMGTAAGMRMLYLLKRGSYLVNMRQSPPLVTLWVYTVIQLDLRPACLELSRGWNILSVEKSRIVCIATTYYIWDHLKRCILSIFLKKEENCA